jgi:hypothetical protein
VFELAPIGSQVVPMPEQPEQDNSALGRSFRGQRGRVLLRESVQVSAAGGPQPATDWRPADLTPDLQRAMMPETLEAARNGIIAVFGLLPGLFAARAQGALIREGQRHLAAWTLQPMAAILAEEATAKLGGAVTIDTLRPLQAYDAGGRARAMLSVVQALAMAKSGEVSQADMNAAFDLVDL